MNNSERVYAMKKVLFMHTGSGNHGCEAIVRTTAQLLEGPQDVVLWSLTKQEDEKYQVTKLLEKVVESEQIKKYSFAHLETIVRRKLFGDANANINVFLRKLFKDNIAISIGGDNYCYEWSANQAIKLDREIRKYCKFSVLWGCSIDPEAITSEMREDLSKFDLITARESITYEALKRINPNTVLVADPAFLLEKVELPLPEYFVENNTVGINISPLIMKYGIDGNMILKNYEELIRYIIDETDMNICLIPHVVWDYNNDLEPLQILYTRFKDSKRICMIKDGDCRELKGYIARCRFFVGARTHATIAAYSSFVPTLVVGYSVKSRGIAKDLFGTDEHYVLPVQKLKSEQDLVKHFRWIMKNEKEQRRGLEKIMKGYKNEAEKARLYLNKLE